MPDTVLSSPACSIAYSACYSIRKRRLAEVSSFSRTWGCWAGGRGSKDHSPVVVMKSHVVWATCTDSPCSLTDMWKIPSVNFSRLPMAVVETLSAWLLFKNTISLRSQDQVFMGAAIFQQPVTYGYSCDICLTHSRVNEKSFVPCVMVGNQPGKPAPKEPSFRISVHTYAPSEPLLGQTYTRTRYLAVRAWAYPKISVLSPSQDTQ